VNGGACVVHADRRKGDGAGNEVAPSPVGPPPCPASRVATDADCKLIEAHLPAGWRELGDAMGLLVEPDLDPTFGATGAIAWEKDPTYVYAS